MSTLVTISHTFIRIWDNKKEFRTLVRKKKFLKQFLRFMYRFDMKEGHRHRTSIFDVISFTRL